MGEKSETAKKNIENNTEKYSKTLNKLRQVVGDNEEYQKAVERDKAKYRFFYEKENIKKTLDTIDVLCNKLHSYEYTVDIIEDFECKDVTKDKRYTIRVAKGIVFVEVDLLEYKEKINDFEFDVLVFWEEYINKINGGIVSESVEIAELVSQYLSYIMYFRYLFKATYKTIGWEKYIWDKTEWIFKYDQIYSRIPRLEGYVANGYEDGLTATKDMEDIGNAEGRTMTLDKESGMAYCINWVINTIGLMKKHDIIALLLGAGVSGVVRSLLPFTKETNININITGEPASGKSIIGHYILSIFGDPERLEGSFTDTDNAMEQKRVQRPILPYILDERMLKVEGESEEKKNQTILMDIFREYEGKVKERLGKQYQEYSGERTYGPIISSSVDSMMELVFNSRDLGQYRRFTEFNVAKKDKSKEGTYILFDNAEEAKQTEEIAYKYYGYGIIILVEYLLDILNVIGEQDILNRFNIIDNDIANKLSKEEENEKITGLTSSSKRFALIILSYQIFREALIMYMTAKNPKLNTEEIFNNRQQIIEQSELLKDRSQDIIDILIDNVKQKFKKVSLYERLTNNLYDYIVRHKDNDDWFFTCDNYNTGWYKDGEEEDNTRYLGKVIDNGENIEICLYNTYHIDRFLFMPIIPEPQIIHNYIVELEDNDKKGAEELLKQYGALSKSQAKAYLDNNTQYKTKKGSYPFGRKDKDQAYIIIIPKKQADTDSDKEETK